MFVYVPIVMYGQGFFLVVLQELQCLIHVIIIRDIGFYHLTKFRYSTPSGF